MSAPVILTVTRDVAAPPERVFEAWLDPAQASIAIAANEAGCELRLTHEMAPERAAYEDRTRHGLTTILAGLAQTLGDQG